MTQSPSIFSICVVESSSTRERFTEHISNGSDMQFEKLTSLQERTKGKYSLRVFLAVI